MTEAIKLVRGVLITEAAYDAVHAFLSDRNDAEARDLIEALESNPPGFDPIDAGDGGRLRPQGASIPTEQGQQPAAHVKGPVEILCGEIAFPWDRRLEREDLFIAFVRELVEEVAQRRDIAVRIAAYTGKLPSADSCALVDVARSMTAFDLGLSHEARLGLAEIIHDRSHEINPDDGLNCDHDVDMLSSCASAIRFGMEKPCRSRHAAEAASHVWKHVYGVTLFDSHTLAWQKNWTRQKLTSALLSLLPVRGDGDPSTAGTEQAQRGVVSSNLPPQGSGESGE